MSTKANSIHTTYYVDVKLNKKLHKIRRKGNLFNSLLHKYC